MEEGKRDKKMEKVILHTIYISQAESRFWAAEAKREQDLGSDVCVSPLQVAHLNLKSRMHR